MKKVVKYIYSKLYHDNSAISYKEQLTFVTTTFIVFLAAITFVIAVPHN